MVDSATLTNWSVGQQVELFRALEKESAQPYFRRMSGAVGAVTSVEGADKIMLGSNNYLGLANDPRINEAAHRAIRRFGSATTGSRLLNGTTDLHIELEAELAEWHGAADAVLFTTGYQANIGTISAVVGAGDAVVVDTAAHASIHDGCRLSGASVRSFAHNDIETLCKNLDRFASRDASILVIVDGLYSMHGDLAALDDIARVCGQYGTKLMVDEAHSVGLHGPSRTGAADLYGVAGAVDIRMGSLSKGLASTGGFVVGDAELCSLLRLRSRAFLFTTAGVPASLAAALEAVRIQRSDEGAERANAVFMNAELLRGYLSDVGVPSGGVSPVPTIGESTGPIIPVAIDSEEQALGIWHHIFEHGVYASLAVFPAVPAGQPILRLCVTAAHTPAHLARAAEVIGDAVRKGRHD